MNKKIKIKGQLKTYLQWPIFLTILLVVMNVWVYLINLYAGFFVSACILIYLVIALVLYFYNKPLIMNELISFATQYGQIQKTLLRKFEIPYALLDTDGKLLWMNKEFSLAIGKERSYRKSISNIFSEITKAVIPEGNDSNNIHISYEDRDYRVSLQRISLESIAESVNIVEIPEVEGYLVAIYLFDETDLKKYERENSEQRLTTGLIYIDNYEEVLESVEDVRSSMLVALIDRKINKYISSFDGIAKKLEKDKYFIILKQKDLLAMQEARFPLLEEVKTVNIGNEMAVTLSIGIGKGGDSYLKNAEYARTAIDLALGRGGDQAVVKENEKINYYGGKSQQIEKNTRVKARVKAHALHEIIQSKERVIVMGHKITDVDSFGASVGIFCAANALNKKAYIVINDITTSVRPLINCFINNPDYDRSMFVKSQEAIDLCDENTVVVVVDTNRPSYTECEELLSLTKTIVVLDHHRRGSEIISNAVLSYVEPFASSACEMVAEILQYFAEGVRIKSVEADCIYGGIIIDTNNFMTKTGVRTFEAAAFLRRCGADVTRVRKMFRDEMADYKARAEAVRHSEVYQKFYAISQCPSEGLESPTIVGAQAANELLNIVGVKASFVVTEYNNRIFISARSIDEVNVQVVMERLGGGGHMNIAGAQMDGITIEETRQKIKEVIDTMIKEGELT